MESQEKPITNFHKEVRNRLAETMFGNPVSKGQLILIANDTNSLIKTTRIETELTLPDTSKFTVSNEGRILSDVSAIPEHPIFYDGKPAGYKFEYIYDKAEKGGVIQIGSYITTDGRIIKDVNHTYFPSGESVTFFYDKETGELKAPKDIDITDSEGNGVPFSITPN